MTRLSKIHPSAIISKGAVLGSGVEIGPYTLIGPKVKIGNDTRIAGHVVIEGQTTIGQRCRIFAGACLGTPAQTRESEGVRSFLTIGDDNLIREYSTINSGMKDGSKTVLGNGNMLMIQAHVAHDCVLGNDIILANNVALAGHVTVEDRVVIGGLVGVHQYVRIGKLAMIGGVSKVVMDVAPFSIGDGHPAKFCGMNAIGLRRAGYRSGQMTQIKKALKALLGTRLNLSRAVSKVEKQFAGDPDVSYLLSFIQKSKRGLTRVSTVKPDNED